jgi:uncharacterized repeat protein (TIGR03803 family)
MRGQRLLIGLKATLLAICTVTLFLTSTYAATERVLYNFKNDGMDANHPEAGLIFDAAGNLYGATSNGGAYGVGAVFELTPAGGGGWAEEVLYSFDGGDGNNPYARLIFDATGNLYGTTLFGGAYDEGVVFELTPTGGGGWVETVLHTFNPGDGKDGGQPQTPVTLDAAGNLYGTTFFGGAYNKGTVFELTPTMGGAWEEKVLHSFDPSNGKDGGNTQCPVILDAAGDLYGTTWTDGAGGGGTAFEFTPTADGGWTYHTLHNFNGTNGSLPSGGLTFDAAGNLYGTTFYGGTFGEGTVFELLPTASGGRASKLLYSLDGADGGGGPLGYLIFDAAGNLYGMTENDGAHGGGTVFELTPEGGGAWHEKILHAFGSDADGSLPQSGMTFDAAGNLYGTTFYGGTFGEGTVFEITP